jgi:hypothetical protein
MSTGVVDDGAPSVSRAAMAQAAGEIVSIGEQHGVQLRAVGGVGIWQRLSAETRASYEQVRPVPSDVDLLAAPKSSKAVTAVFERLPSYAPDERLIAWHGERRHRYFRTDDQGQSMFDVDVFIGKPPLCHEIEFSDRLDASGFSMAPTDLLLQKLQVHETTSRDLIDISYLLLEFPPQDGAGDDGIDAARIVDLTSQDWGFYYTTTSNLGKVTDTASSLTESVGSGVIERAQALTAAIEDAPKSRRWKLRARVGTKMQWYEDVEELVR